MNSSSRFRLFILKGLCRIFGIELIVYSTHSVGLELFVALHSIQDLYSSNRKDLLKRGKNSGNITDDEGTKVFLHSMNGKIDFHELVLTVVKK